MGEQWNGAAWSVVRVPLPVDSRDASLNSVSCGGPSDCTAVGNMLENSGQPPETLIEHWDGVQWSVVPSPNVAGAAVSNLWAVSCAAGSNCTAVGDSAMAGSSTTTANSSLSSSPGSPSREPSTRPRRARVFPSVAVGYPCPSSSCARTRTERMFKLSPTPNGAT
jgi:hypothetical protein